jgi:predicted dehydrogenase
MIAAEGKHLMSEMTAVGVIGCGRMGKLHSRVYSQMPNVKLVGVYDTFAANAQSVAEQFKCQAFKSIEEMLTQVKAVTIATPTEMHLATACQCLSAGVACLIEKPLARSVDECREIVALAKKHNTTLQVGHVERFNPAIRALTKLELKPRFIETVRVSPLTFRSIDVGVVLDVMIHDIDIVLSLVRSPVKSVQATGVSVIGTSEDICNARVTFENGCVANLTGSRMALKVDRRLRVATSDAWVAVDYAKKQGIIWRRSDNVDAIRQTAAKVRAGEITDPTKLNYAELLKMEQLRIEEVEPLRAEQDAFIAAAISGTRPVVSGEDGMAAVELAERIVKAMGPTSI